PLLDQAVLEGVEADHDAAPAGREAAREGREEAGELVELAVDRDAQGLEGLGRRVDAQAAAGRLRVAPLDQRREVRRGREPSVARRLGQALGDPPRVALLAEVPEDRRELVDPRGADELEGGRAAA